MAEYFIEKSNLLETEHDERLYHLLQFLNFIKTLNREECSLHFVEKRRYVIQQFYLKDFMNFIDMPSTKQTQFHQEVRLKKQKKQLKG